MTILRLKAKRQEEQRINKVKDLMQMFHLADTNQQGYQPTGASSSTIDANPTIAKTRELWQMFHLER